MNRSGNAMKTSQGETEYPISNTQIQCPMESSKQERRALNLHFSRRPWMLDIPCWLLDVGILCRELCRILFFPFLRPATPVSLHSPLVTIDKARDKACDKACDKAFQIGFRSRCDSGQFSIFSFRFSIPLIAFLALAEAAFGQAPGTGGFIRRYRENGTNFFAHIFTNSAATDTFTITGNTNVDYLVVAGGGGGGGSSWSGGGGGGGGVRFGRTNVTASTTYSVVVGVGGLGYGGSG